MTVTSMPSTEEKKSGGGNIRLVLIAVVLMAVLAAGVYFLFLKPKPKGVDKCTPETVGQAGCEIGDTPLALSDTIQVNLAGGHYLRVGLALQLNKSVKDASTLSPAPAFDAAIDLFTGLPMDDVNTAKTREALKAQLASDLMKVYPDNEVLGVLFTQFVTQ